MQQQSAWAVDCCRDSDGQPLLRTVMIRIVAYFEPEFDFSHVVKEWCAEASKELDFNQEAKK